MYAVGLSSDGLLSGSAMISAEFKMREGVACSLAQQSLSLTRPCGGSGGFS